MLRIRIKKISAAGEWEGYDDVMSLGAINGDDWFYFEDETSSNGMMSPEKCASSADESPISIEADSGSDTSLINFRYKSTPTHKVLHEGSCNFAGLKPVSGSTTQYDLDTAQSRSSRFRAQTLG